MVGLHPAAEDGFTVGCGVPFKNLPGNSSCSDLIAPISDADALNRETQPFRKFEKKMGFPGKSSGVLQTGIKTLVSNQRREKGLKIFYGRRGSAFLGKEGIERMVGSDPFDIDKVGEISAQRAVIKIFYKTDRNRATDFLVIHSVDVILVRMLQWKADDGNFFFREVKNLQTCLHR